MKYLVSLVYCNKEGCGIASLDKRFSDLNDAQKKYQEYKELAIKEVKGKPFPNFSHFELSLSSIEESDDGNFINELDFEVIAK